MTMAKSQLPWEGFFCAMGGQKPDWDGDKGYCQTSERKHEIQLFFSQILDRKGS